MSGNVNELEARLAHVERSQRHHRRVSMVLGVALGVTLALGAVGPQDAEYEMLLEPVAEVLRAKRIDIVDESGRVTCTLMTELLQEEEGVTGGGLLVLRNSRGRSVCRLGSHRGGGGAVSLHRASGTTGCAISASDAGGAMELYGSEGEPLSALRTDSGAGSLVLRAGADVGVTLASDELGGLATTPVAEE